MKMSRIETGMRLALAFYEAFNNQDLPAMTALISDDCVLEASTPAPDGRLCEGKAAITGFWQETFRSSPDLQIELQDIFGLGRRVVAQYRLADSGTLLSAVDLLRVQSEAITEIKSYTKN
jgi:hypothetical protein